MAEKPNKTQELIEACKRTSIINRGQYPVTKTTNVFKEDGSPLEEPAAEDGEDDADSVDKKEE